MIFVYQINKKLEQSHFPVEMKQLYVFRVAGAI